MSITYDKAKVKDKWGLCLSCQTLRFIVSRGLCLGCWKNPDIRQRFKDKRLVARNPITAKQHEILNNPALTEPHKMFFLAFRLMKRYGDRIQIDDLKQIGWLVMIKGVKDYNPDWTTTLFRYCKRGISSEMERHCLQEIRSSTMGVSHEDFVDFMANDTIRGGVSRYTLGMTFNVTNHALERYRERVNETATRKDIKRQVEHSIRVPLEIEDMMLDRQRTHRNNSEIREYQGIYFVMGEALHLWSKQQQVITCFTKEQSAAFRKGILK